MQLPQHEQTEKGKTNFREVKSHNNIHISSGISAHDSLADGALYLDFVISFILFAFKSIWFRSYIRILHFTLFFLSSNVFVSWQHLSIDNQDI